MTVDIDEDVARIHLDNYQEMARYTQRLMRTYMPPNRATMTCWYPHTTFIYESLAGDGRMRLAWIVTTFSPDALTAWLEAMPRHE